MKTTPLDSWIMKKTGIAERSRDSLEAYQLDRLKETIAYAKKNSRYYGELLKNIREEDMKALDDIRSIPFTFPQHIGERPLDFLCVPQRAVARIVTLNTSGTTGGAKRIFFSEEDLGLTVDFFIHGMSCLTDETDSVLVLLPSDAYGSIGDLLKRALAVSKVKCIVYGVLADPDEVEECIRQNDITCIVGIPLQVLYLSRVKGEVFKENIRKVLLSTDYVPDVLCAELTQKFGCSVFSHYGMTEMGYGGGVECEALSGYHMREGDLYFEIVNPDTGEPVEDGQYGEVVFTTLTRKAMPLIRYRTGDIASFSQPICACGTFLKTMKKVLGRKDNRVFLGENCFLYLRELDELLLSFEEIMDYKACIEDGNKFVLNVTTQGSKAYESLKEKLNESMEVLLSEQPTPVLQLEITENPEHKPSGITSSMIKRKIIDNRSEG